MSSKVVVIISTGDSEKALTGLMYARNAMQRGWMNDVKVIFFGPSERLLVEDERVAEMAKEICAAETPLACKFISDRDGVSEKIENLGIKVDYVGEIISGLLKDGYAAMVF